MHYEKKIVEGCNEWILFVHGLGGSTKTWKYQVDAFGEYNQILVDLEGHGKSEFFATKKAEILAAYEIEHILEEEGIEKVHIVSMSLGTIVAMEFACLFPSKVESMVLAGCVLNLKRVSKFLLNFANILKHIVSTNFAYKFFSKIIMPNKEQAISRRIFLRESLKMSHEAFKSWISTLINAQKRLEAYLQNITKNHLDVLFISGKNDYFFVKGIKELSKKVKNVKFLFLERSGHVCSIDAKNCFNEIVQTFLKNHTTTMQTT